MADGTRFCVVVVPRSRVGEAGHIYIYIFGFIVVSDRSHSRMQTVQNFMFLSVFGLRTANEAKSRSSRCWYFLCTVAVIGNFVISFGNC
jgi:hypothetical protein